MTDAGGRSFSVPFRIRFDEAGPDGRLRTSSALRYAQDLAWQHSTERGFDRAWYDGHALTWLVRAANLEIQAAIPVGDMVIGTTEVVGFRRVWSRRRSTFRDQADAIVATVDIDWVLLDGRGAPTRIPPVFGEAFGAPAATFQLGRVTLGPTPPSAVTRAFTVRPQELDPLDHVNNAVYADWLDEAVIAAGDVAATRAVPRTARLEYAAAAGPGETVESTVWAGADGWLLRVAGPAGTELLRASLSA